MRVKLEPNAKILRIYKVKGGISVIKSFEYYNYVGLRRCNYTRWMTDTVFVVGENGDDYFAAPNNIDKSARGRIRYYFSIDFAIALCLVVRTKQAIQLRKILMDKK